MNVWVYVQTESGLFTVGHYDPVGRFKPESDHCNSEEAATRCHWLNGGQGVGGKRERSEVDRMTLHWLETGACALKDLAFAFEELAEKVQYVCLTSQVPQPEVSKNEETAGPGAVPDEGSESEDDMLDLRGPPYSA